MTCAPRGRRASSGLALRQLILVSLALACPAFGQSPPPAVPEESAPPPPSSTAKADSPWLQEDATAEALSLQGEGAGPHGWNYSAHAEGGWESNPVFESSDDPSSARTRMGAGIGYQTAGRRSAFAVNANGGGTVYFNLDGRDTYYYSGSLSWLHRFSPRTSFTLAEDLTNDYTQRSSVLVGSGILLPLDRALTSRTTANLRQTLTPRVGLEARVQFDYVDFASPTLADGDQLDANLAINRRLDDRQAVALSYDFLSSNTGGQPRRSYHSGYLGWSSRLSLTATVNANLGFTALPQTDGSWHFIPSAIARLSALNSRTRTRIDARYEHRASQDFGVGQDRIADIAAITAVRPLGRRFSSTLGFNYTFSKDPGADSTSFRYSTQSANAGLGYRVNRRVGLDLGYSYFRSSQVSPSVDDHTVSLGVTYKKEPE